MYNILRFLLLAISLLFSMGTVFAIEMPFTDVRSSDLYYDSVRELYEGRVISDSGDHLFRPNDLMSRDFFVSLAVGIGCHKCETPSVEDIITYQVSPFVDLPKTNQFYYCIAYAKDNDITQGYITDASGKATCENSKQYMSSPFCAENTISRIESAAILLRRAKLWDDTLNSGNFDKSTTIPDVTTYWYGYAKKGIEIGIITQKADGKMGQDEKISRGEFAIMAARILRYTQCQPDIITNTIEAQIGIRNKNQELIQKSKFNKGEEFSIVPITSNGTWNYNWIVKNPNTGEVITLSGNTFPGSKLPEGTWIINLQIIDPTTDTIVSEPSVTITVGTSNTYSGDIAIQDKNGNLSNENVFSTGDSITFVSTHTGGPWDQTWEAIDKNTGTTITGNGKELPGSKLGEGNWTITLITRDPGTNTIVDTDIREVQIVSGPTPNTDNNNLTVVLQADPIVSNLGEIIHFSSNTNSTGGLIYKWDFGDGTATVGTGSNNHIYTEGGTYTVILTVIDPKTGNTSQSSVIIRVTGERDTDGDGILDPVDQCVLVYAKTMTGCPNISIYDPQDPTTPTYDNGSNNIEAAIGIRSGSGVATTKISFPKGENFSLIPITGSGNWNYNWHATNPTTGQVLSGTGLVFSGSIFSIGDWKVILDVIDPNNGEIIASPSISIHIEDTNTTTTDSIPCVTIVATPMVAAINSSIVITPSVCTSPNPLIYNWSYGDGTTSNGTGITNHIYPTPGTYTIILTVTDPKTGQTGESTIVVRITGTSIPTNTNGTSDIGIDNICLENRRMTQGLLTGTPNCTQCPCNNTISIDAPLRSCDIVFPTIMSPALDTIYSRGGFYLIP